MTRRRVSCPQVTQQLWDAIKNIRGQRQVPTAERIQKFMLKEFGVSEEEVTRQLNHCVRDGLIEITKRTISKGNYIGSEQEGYKLPLLSLKPDDFDWYCFDCHRAGDVICCSRPNCLRVYHLACISSTDLPEGAFVCHVCKMCEVTPDKFQMKKSKLNRLLGYTLQKLKSKYPLTLKDQRLPPPNKNVLAGSDMNLTLMEDKIDQHRYKLLEEFHVDALNIVHNMVIYNGVDSAVADIARQMLRDCIQDLQEIKQCVDCYKQSHGDKKKLWFCKPCRKPHELVYAKQFGFPYWPAKVIKVEDDQYDVRFFGAQHLRAMIPKAHIRPISVNIHTLQGKRSSAWNKACEELKRHQELLEKARIATNNFTKFVESSSSSDSDSDMASAKDTRHGKSKEASDSNDIESSAREKKQFTRSTSKKETSTSPENDFKVSTKGKNKDGGKIGQRASQRVMNKSEETIVSSSSQEPITRSVSVQTSRAEVTAEESQELVQKAERIAELEKELQVQLNASKMLEVELNKTRVILERMRSDHEDELSEINNKHVMNISEIKKKQWCYNCETEAIYHCCWNTAYCSVECQQAHWQSEHKRVCRRKR
ncbi:zinc finger protein MYND domain-containing protein, putative [Pediculus humanus corporis]|uniref:Zinc finger protein MYND domain-containing protein, putative n=1 Tax=Pediculus humanus subsp. corporis TaxID=121224 RepID=E0VFH3_PEDHC|nr:zinc finger protein MYND domain-containing protein, putative [Pediculus humanus corporis]EEB12129.1 zinc finger protein MYND domain-containing protein, putative [Pediculus humanus corporis]